MHTKNAYLPRPRDLAGKTGVYGISRIRHTAGWEKIALGEQQEKAVSPSAGCKTTATSSRGSSIVDLCFPKW